MEPTAQKCAAAHAQAVRPSYSRSSRIALRSKPDDADVDASIHAASPMLSSAATSVECITLRVTPAMEAGLADHVWSIEEIIARKPTVT